MGFFFKLFVIGLIGGTIGVSVFLKKIRAPVEVKANAEEQKTVEKVPSPAAQISK